MTHLYTQIARADGIWRKGVICRLAESGGGRLVDTRRGVEVHVADAQRWARVERKYNRFYASCPALAAR